MAYLDNLVYFLSPIFNPISDHQYIIYGVAQGRATYPEIRGGEGGYKHFPIVHNIKGLGAKIVLNIYTPPPKKKSLCQINGIIVYIPVMRLGVRTSIL